MATSWRDIKKQRVLQTRGWFCEEEGCGRYLGDGGRYAIGHHIDHNHLNNTVENCRLRCTECEQKDLHAYAIDTGGESSFGPRGDPDG